MGKYILYFVTHLIEASIILYYASGLFQPKHAMKNRCFLLTGLYILLYGVSLFDVKWLNLVLYLSVNIIYLMTQYRLRIRSAIFHAAIIEIVMASCELIVYEIINRFAPDFFSDKNSFDKTSLFIICSKILFFLVVFLIVFFVKQRKKEDNDWGKPVLFLVIIPAMSIIVLLTFVSMSEDYSLTPKHEWLISLNTLFILIINLIVFAIDMYNIKRNREYTEIQMLLQKEKDLTEYYKDTLSLNENQSILIHDIKKHLQVIEGLSENSEATKITEYVRDLLISPSLKHGKKVSDDELINVIFSRYSKECEEKGISLEIDIRRETFDFLDDNDKTSLLCNLFDNAIEASAGLSDAYIEFSVRKKDDTPFVVLSLINSCTSDPFVKPGFQLTTSKKDKKRHGFGLKSIKRIVNRYEGDIQMFYNKETVTFHTLISLRSNC